MTAHPYISVIIPTYNAENFISKCLEHLVHQTYKNIEIIVVDDGSTDNTVKTCKSYAASDKRIRVIRQKNAGPSVAMNTGLDAARAIWKKYYEFLAQHNAQELMDMPEAPYRIEEFKIFNIPITRRAIFYNKIRYYLFGINLGTRKIKK